MALCRLWISDIRQKGGHAVTSGLEPWHSNPRHSCLGPSSLVCVPVRTCMLWSFICRSLSITAMFPKPDHLQQLKMPLQLAGSVGLWSTLHYIIKRSCFAKGCKSGSGFTPLWPAQPVIFSTVFPLWSSGVNRGRKCRYCSSKMMLFSMRSNITSL